MRKLFLLVMINLFAWQMKAQNFSTIYLVGDAFECGWSHEKSYLMKNEGNGIHSWVGKMKEGDFKFLLKTNPDHWLDCLNAKIKNEEIVIGKAHEIVYIEGSRDPEEDLKFMMKEEGLFNVIIDTDKMTLSIYKLISIAPLDGKGKRDMNIHSYSNSSKGDEQSPYKLLIGESENLKGENNKWVCDSNEPWVIFSLPGIYSLRSFGFRDAKVKDEGENAYNVPEYKVYVSTTGVEDEDWIEAIHEVGKEGENVKEHTLGGVEARYIKFVPIKNPQATTIDIYGVDIYGAFVSPIDETISTGKTIVDYHDCWSSRETPANILDGISEGTPDESHKGVNNPWAFGNNGNEGWVVIDLENSYSFDKFVLVDSEAWITGYEVYTSTFYSPVRGGAWELVASGTFEKEEIRKELVVPASDRPAMGRFIKLVIPAEHQNELTRIREFEVYGADNSQKYEIQTNNADLKAAYELAIATVNINEFPEGILKAGATYKSQWTRDLAINVWNGYAFMNPALAKNSLLNLLEDNPQQYIGEEYWDKIIWVKGAWIYYLATGDEEFLHQAFKSGMNTMEQLKSMTRNGDPVYDVNYGLFTGPSVFNDGIAGYDEPVYDNSKSGEGAVVSHPAHTQIKCLSTNCIYYEAYRLLAKMAEIIGEEASVPDLEQAAEDLKESIRTHLFTKETGKLNYLIDQYGDLHPHQEGLGLSFAILFDIVTEEEAKKIVEETFVTKFGLPSISPHFKRWSDDKPGRHNMMIWPFVNGFWADACLKTGYYDKFTFELFNLANLALNTGGNCFWEIYDPKDGSPDGGWQQFHWPHLEDQTWSATGFLNMVWYGLVGMQLEENKIVFNPYLPKEVNQLKLANLKYGNSYLEIEMEGEGTKIKEFKINGVATDKPELEINTGEQQEVKIHIVMEKDQSVGMETIQQEEPFTVFTQNGSVVVRLNSESKAESVQLFDVTGKMIFTKNVVTQTEILGNNLVEGVYLVRLECNGIVYLKKVIV